MDCVKLWRKDFKKNSPVFGFNYYLHELGIKNNLWPQIWMVMIYLTGEKLNKCIAEIYDQNLESIKQ